MSPLAATGRTTPLRHFALVGASVTALDMLALAVLSTAGLSVVVADTVAVAAASLASWALHRTAAKADDPILRWTRRPAAVAAVLVSTGGLDVAVVGLVVDSGSPSLAGLLGAKVLALIIVGAARAIAYRILLARDIRRDLARRRPLVEPPGDLRLTVVVPAYREGQRIAETVRQISAALEPVQFNGGVEIVVVDDGSQDETAELAGAVGARVVRLPRNCGKGAAVRAGVLAARGRTVAFTDADLAQPPGDLLILLAKVESGWDVAVGTRHHSAAQRVARGSLVRWFSTHVFNVLTALVLLGGYRDTQCGCKAFRGDVARHLFSRARVDGFAFDVELFHMVERYRFSCIQVPVMRRPSVSSTIRLGPHAVQMVRDLWRIRRWASMGAYDLISEAEDIRPKSREPAPQGPA